VSTDTLSAIARAYVKGLLAAEAEAKMGHRIIWRLSDPNPFPRIVLFGWLDQLTRGVDEARERARDAWAHLSTGLCEGCEP